MHAYPTAREAMTDKPMSRQRKWQQQRVKEGKCKTCGKPRNGLRYECDECNEKTNARQRLQLQLKKRH